MKRQKVETYLKRETYDQLEAFKHKLLNEQYINLSTSALVESIIVKELSNQ